MVLHVQNNRFAVGSLLRRCRTQDRSFLIYAHAPNDCKRALAVGLTCGYRLPHAETADFLDVNGVNGREFLLWKHE